MGDSISKQREFRTKDFVVVTLHSEYIIMAECWQFWLCDENADIESGDWTTEGGRDLLAVGQGSIFVGTIDNSFVNVQVEVRDVEPVDDLEEWDHVTECSIEVRSGRLAIGGITDSLDRAARINLNPGVYRTRIHYSGREHDWTVPYVLERFRILLWRGQEIAPRVLKRWHRRS